MNLAVRRGFFLCKKGQGSIIIITDSYNFECTSNCTEGTKFVRITKDNINFPRRKFYFGKQELFRS